MNTFHEDNQEKIEKAFIDWEEDLAKIVIDEWEKGQQYYDQMNDLYDTLYDMLRGERPEKNYDWQSNLVLNKVFQVIWTAIPYITQKIFGASPIIGIKSYEDKGAWQRREILEFWHTMNTPVDKKHISFYVVCVMWLLRGLLNGVGIVKKSWHQKLKTETKDVITQIPIGESEGELITEPFKQKTTITTPIEDWPHNQVINNKDIVFDPMLKPGQSIRDGRYIIHREHQDSVYLDSQGYDVDDLLDAEKINENLNKDGLEQQPKSDIYTEIEVFERQGLLPVSYKDGEMIFDVDGKMVETIALIGKSKDKSKVLKLRKNPYGFKTYIDIHIYLDAERWQSMGMIEPIKDVYTAINDNMNAAFDEINQNLMPPTIINKFALWDTDTMVYAPGQKWLVGGNPRDHIYFKEPSYVTKDTWTRHSLLDSELQLTTAITPPMQGMGKEKAATTNVLNVQMSAGRLDHIVKMIEQTGLIPSAQMDVLFAKKFAHPKTFEKILGEPFQYGEDEEIYKYIPAASSVKLEMQKQQETMEDIQLIQILSSIQNPNMPKLVNKFLANILRNRNAPEEAELLDPSFYEPKSGAGNLQMMERSLGRVPSNEHGVEMTGQEKATRRLTYKPQGM